MTADFLPFYLRRGEEEYRENRRNLHRGLARDEQFVARMRAHALTAAEADAEAAWRRYRQLCAGRLIGRNLGVAHIDRRLAEAPGTPSRGPYEMSAAALAAARARARDGKGGR
ncbi:MAG: hypothetical protein GX595_20375 [Lentisphaerae bacterium]|nr:hypothetical protein [Lentisphaerota bacterium]